MNTTDQPFTDEELDVLLSLSRGRNSFAMTPEETAKHHSQLAQYRKMLAQNGRIHPHMLVVEDQSFSRNLLYEVLHDTCTVTACANAVDGWKAYLEETPDIAFLDIGLPDADGHALANHIKKLDPLSYIVMVTTSQDIFDVQAAKKNRVDGFIVKPFNKKTIDECVTRYQAMHKPPLTKTAQVQR